MKVQKKQYPDAKKRKKAPSMLKRCAFSVQVPSTEYQYQKGERLFGRSPFWYG